MDGTASRWRTVPTTVIVAHAGGITLTANLAAASAHARRC
jgi:hypothetical protein